MVRGKSLLEVMDARELEKKRGPSHHAAEPERREVPRDAPREDLWARMLAVKQRLWRSVRHFFVAFAIVLVAILVHSYEPFRVKAAVVIGTTGASEAVRALSVAVPIAVVCGVGLAWVS
jgi:hypothetical protein